MSDPRSLSELYREELQDLWSANDQMKRVVSDMIPVAANPNLSEMLERSAKGIQVHTDLLKDLLEQAGGEPKKEHCRGMEGLVREARKHAIEVDSDDSVRDVAIVAQYQRMCHYGIAGFGTAKTYADALGKTDHAQKLDQALSQIYSSDEYATALAERSQSLQAAN